MKRPEANIFDINPTPDTDPKMFMYRWEMDMQSFEVMLVFLYG